MSNPSQIEPDSPAPAAKAGADLCPQCQRPKTLCICEVITTIDNRVHVLVLQHPQEQDKELGTARILVQSLKHATHRIGLSWPSLSKIMGAPTDPHRWAVLYLGSIRPRDFPPDADIALFDRKGTALEDQRDALAGLHGVIVLDGTWAQAKTLWWRNAWMLKCRRIALNPSHPSLYAKLRREPRREALSTIEATAMLLARIEKKPALETNLLTTFGVMLEKLRQVKQAERRAAKAASKSLAPDGVPNSSQ